ncbi:MAG: helix-turn-helix transcriptional regulator [bacterium]
MEDPKQDVAELLSQGIITVTSLAERSGISRATISNWLSGRSTISPDSLRDVLTAAVEARDEVRWIMAGDTRERRLEGMAEAFRNTIGANGEPLFVQSARLQQFEDSLIDEIAARFWPTGRTAALAREGIIGEEESNYGSRTSGEGDPREAERQPVETGGSSESAALDSEGV